MKNIKQFEDFINEEQDITIDVNTSINLKESTIINEDGDGGGGVAMASSGTTSGMGNVASAQPASTPGAAVTGDGTTGSGDYGNPLFPTSQKDGSNKIGKKRGKKDKKNKKKESIIQNFLAQHKASKDKDGTSSSKMFSFNDFVKNDIKK